MSQAERELEVKDITALICPALNVLQAIKLGIPYNEAYVDKGINNLLRLLEVKNETNVAVNC